MPSGFDVLLPGAGSEGGTTTIMPSQEEGASFGPAEPS